MSYMNIRKDEQRNENDTLQVLWGLSGTNKPIDGNPWQYLIELMPQRVSIYGEREYLFSIKGLKNQDKIDFTQNLFEQYNLQLIEPAFLEAVFLTGYIEHTVEKLGELLEREKDYDYWLEIPGIEKKISDIVPLTIKRCWHAG